MPFFLPVLPGSFLLRGSRMEIACPCTGLNHPAYLLQIGNSMHFGGGALPPGGGKRPYRKAISLGERASALLKIAITHAGKEPEKEMASLGGKWPFCTGLARPTGVEPVTLGFGNQYSIQLSYGRVVRCAV